MGHGGTTLTSEEEARNGRGRKMTVGEPDGGQDCGASEAARRPADLVRGRDVG